MKLPTINEIYGTYLVIFALFTISEKESMVKLFVVGFPLMMGEIELLEIFSNYCLVSQLNIVKENGQSLGYGFVDVQDLAAAKRAIDALNGKFIGNRKINVKIAEKRSGEKARKQTQ